MSSSGADASNSNLDAALALLSGPDLVAHLCTTCRRADYDAAARVLADRDRWLAEAEAKLAEAQTGLADLAAQVRALEQRYLQLKAQRSPRSSGGAIAAAAPRVGRRAEEPGPKVAIDLCGSSDDDDGKLEEGEFRTGVPAAGVSRNKRKEPAASEGDEGRRRAGVSCKRKEPASASSPDDEDDIIPLSQLIKKRRRAKRGVSGEPKKGHGDVRANSARPFGVDRPVISPVNRGIPEAVAEHMVGSPDPVGPKVAVFVQGTRNGRSGKDGGLSRTMPSPPPTGSAAGNIPRKNGSESDGSEPEGRARIGPENDAPVQVRTPSVTDTARRIVGSARVGAETPMEQHTDSSSDGTVNVVLKSIEEHGKAIIGGVHKTKVSLETNGTGDKASIVLKDTSREQGKPDGQVLHTKMLSRTDGIREQGGKLSPCKSRLDAHGGRPTTSDKPVSATLQQKNQLAQHSEQMSVERAYVSRELQVSVESSLPSAVTRHWKSSSSVLVSCLQNNEICLQAACALHRQRKFTTQPTEGGRSGCTGLSKFDAYRTAVLVEFLLDGNLQGPLKRTVEDLAKHDSTGYDLLERVVLQCSEQLFSIYKNKDDKYFR